MGAQTVQNKSVLGELQDKVSPEQTTEKNKSG